MDAIKLPISSDMFNVINFLLFDLFLAALFYSLTADVAGLYNMMCALREKKDSVRFYNLPLVGVGITCTNRLVSYALGLTRAVSFILIFATIFLAAGEQDIIFVRRKDTEVVLGNLSINEDFFKLAPRALARQGCQGRTQSGTYYGQLLQNGYCELNVEQIVPQIQFDFEYKPKKLDLHGCLKEDHLKRTFSCDKAVEVVCAESNYSNAWTGCTIKSRPSVPKCVSKNMTGDANVTFTCSNHSRDKSIRTLKKCNRISIEARHNFRCSNARISCVPFKKEACVGAVNIDGVTHFCRGAGLYKGLEKNGTVCKRAEGADWTLDEWFFYSRYELRNLEYAYAAMYGSGLEERDVSVKDQKQVTRLKKFWYVILAFKVGAAAGLGVLVLILRKTRGLLRVANDEVGLASLLLQSTSAATSYGTIASGPKPDNRSNIVVEMTQGVVRIIRDDPKEVEGT